MKNVITLIILFFGLTMHSQDREVFENLFLDGYDDPVIGCGTLFRMEKEKLFCYYKEGKL